jgi:hypothetical protein
MIVKFIYGICAILGGALWGVVKYLINHEPYPYSYDDYNRMLTVPLLLMLIGFIGVHIILLKKISKAVAVASIVTVIGLALLLIGNIAEFWLVLLQSKPNAYDAFKSGSSDVWIGSHVGWATFCIGMLTTAITSLIIGIILIKRKIANYWNLFVPVFGIVGLLSFGFEILLVPFGLGWVLMGGYLIVSRKNF